MWDINEAIDYYRNQGAPGDQTALINLLKEIQSEHEDILNRQDVEIVAKELEVKESFLMAIIKRFPSLKFKDVHLLEVCKGEMCSRRTKLSGILSKLPSNVEVKGVGCMRMCAKGPNIRYDGQVYNNVDEELIKKLINIK